MDREATIEYMFRVRETGEFAPQAVIHLGDGRAIAILMLWDDESKMPMLEAVSTLAGGIGAEKIELMNDVWTSTPEGTDKYGMPRNDPDRTEAMLLTEVWHDRTYSTCIPYTEIDGRLERGEPYEGKFDGRFIDAIRFGLIAGREGAIGDDKLREAAEMIGLDLDALEEE